MSASIIADIQKYWDSRPCNSRHSLVDINRQPFAYSWQVAARKYHVEPHIPGFAEFERWRGRTVLELGCGIGTDTLAFAAHGAGVVAVDISERSLEIARRRAVALGLGHRIRFIQGDIEELGALLVPAAKFDLIYSFGVLHHTPHPERVLRQVKHCMLPSSTLKVMLYHRYTPKVLSALVHYWRPGMAVDDAVAKMSEAQAGCPLTRTYTRASAAELLHDFEILDMRIDHIFPYRIEDYVQHRYVLNWWWHWTPRKMFRFLERRFGWHLLITARLAC